MSLATIHRFENGGDSLIITDVRTPRFWKNYLWSEEGYCVEISQIGHGRSYYIDPKANLCQINNQEARYVYLRDEDSGTCWNVGEAPLLEPVDNYSCEHHIASTRIQSEKDGIAASWRVFVPLHGFHEVWTIGLSNRSQRPRTISVFSLVSFELEGFKYPRYYEMYRTCETDFDPAANGIYCSSRHPFAPHERYNGFLASTDPVHAYDGDLTAFCGSIGSLQRPETVVQRRDCSNSLTALFVLGGVLQHKVTLEPGESRDIGVLYGVAESREEVQSLVKQYQAPGVIEKTLEKTRNSLLARYNTLSIRTPDEKVNSILNNWTRKQLDFSIVGKKGVRDNLQIAVSMLLFRPERAREEIIETMRHQFKDGHAVLSWLPYDDTRYSDQPFWIVWAVNELIKETGDLSILELDVEWQDGGSAKVYEHIKAALNRLLSDKGRNGLTRIFFADWNDALNVTTDWEAESVMLSQQLCLALKQTAALANRIGDSAYATELMGEYETLREAINTRGWDGQWYVRAIAKDEVIGSKNSDGSQIYCNAQVWAVLADVPDAERLPLVLKSLEGMEHEFGYPINMPAYEKFSPHVGRMAGMLPGLFENGGVYCHATAFKMLMDTHVGRADEALKTLHMILPDSAVNPSTASGADPHLFTNCFALHPKYYGKSYMSRTTGTAAWCMMALYEGIMGMRRDYDGLRIRPCFPASWEKAEVTRVFRGARYHVTILNPKRLSNLSGRITVDGNAIEGDLLPLFSDDKTHEVVVDLG